MVHATESLRRDLELQRYAAGQRFRLPVDDGHAVLLEGAVKRLISSSQIDRCCETIDKPGSVFGGPALASFVNGPEFEALVETQVLRVPTVGLGDGHDESSWLRACGALTQQAVKLAEQTQSAQAALAHMSRRFEEHANLEQLVALFVSSLVDVGPEVVGHAMEASMALLGNYFGADGVFFYRNRAEPSLLERQASWVGFDAPDWAPVMRSLGKESGAWLWKQMSSQELLAVGRLSALPAEAAGFREICEAASVGALMCVPAHHRDKVDGFLMLLSPRSQDAWKADNLPMLAIIAEIIAKALARRDLDSSLHQLAHYDGLTGLPNRALFREQLSQVKARSQRSGSCFGVLMLTIDRFKRVVEGLGFNASDGLVVELAKRLQSIVRKSDTLSRFDGDHFAMIAEDLRSPLDAGIPAEKLHAALRQPFVLYGQELHVSASIGIAVYPDDSEDTAELKRFAAGAMIEAQQAGGNTSCRYRGTKGGESLQRLALESELVHAINRGDIVVYCQPQVFTSDRHFAGGEALVRWQHQKKGLLSPGLFLPIAEESGLIVHLSEFVLSEACRQRKMWPSIAGTPPRIAVNAHARWLNDPNFVASIRATLDRHSVPCEWLEIEITENAVLGNLEIVVARLEQLRAAGIAIALDDFGTGYSSLSYLRRLPVDTLKIDRSFIVDIANDRRDAAIVESIVRLAHSLDLQVVAEGIEQGNQHELLHDLGCDVSQGYLVCRPLPAESFMSWLLDRQSASLPEPPGLASPAVAMKRLQTSSQTH